MLEAEIANVAAEYLQRFPEDSATIDELRRLLEAKANITSRKEFLGHVTCGAIVLDGSNGKLLMIHHRALDKWLFPGGHLEDGDRSLRDAARREVTEETGMPSDILEALGGDLDRIPIHIDCHPIPPNPAKQEPAHRHFDFRYVFLGRSSRVTLQLDEVQDWAWGDAHLAQEPIRGRLLNYKLIA